MKLLLTLTAFCCLFNVSSHAQLDVDITLIEHATGFGNLVDLNSAGDLRLFVIEKGGAIQILHPDGTQSNFLEISVSSGGFGEQGLLGMAFHPDYQNNGYFYINYTRPNGDTRIDRFTVSSDPDVADMSTQLNLMTISQPFGNHNGGNVEFGPDGYLYIGMGDGGSGEDPQNNGQSMDTFLGKMLRIDVDGVEPYEIPPSNPFVGTSADTLPEIWASGLRNPWRYGFDPVDGNLWIADVGQYAWEEIDFQSAASLGGENYGWNCYEGNHSGFGSGCPPMSDFVGAVAEYSHGPGHCSVTGGDVYRGEANPRLQAKYLYTDYCSGQFWSTEVNDADEFTTYTVATSTGGYTGFGTDCFGEMYVLAQSAGKIFEIKDEACENSIATIAQDDVILTATEGISYQWYNGCEAITGATNQTYEVTETGTYVVLVSFSEDCADYSPSMEVIVSGVGLSELQNVHGVSIIQNPIENILEVRFDTQISALLNLEIYDVSGKSVFDTSINAGQNTWAEDLGFLASGRYTLSLSNEDGRSILPFIVSK